MVIVRIMDPKDVIYEIDKAIDIATWVTWPGSS